MLHLRSTKLQRQRSVHMPTVYRGMFNEIISSSRCPPFDLKSNFRLMEHPKSKQSILKVLMEHADI
jgi:hypothetical protein